MMYTDKKLKEYNEREERFRLAIEEATTNKAASINSIANKYKVSRTTLSRRIHGFKNTRNSHEKQQKFTNDEEMSIVEQIQTMLRDQHHIPQKREILAICENMLKEKHKNNPKAQTEDMAFFRVGKNWIDRFLERHNSKLMINESSTLAEYYRNEFLERKKLRGEHGYKSVESSSATPTEENHDDIHHNSTSSASTSTMHDVSQHNSARLPYQPPDQYMYQEQVLINPFSMPPQQSQPQPQPQQSTPQHQQQLPHQQIPSQHTAQHPHSHGQYPDWSHFNSMKQIHSPYVQPQQQPPPPPHPPQQPMSYSSVPPSVKFNYNYSSSSPHVIYERPSVSGSVNPSSFSMPLYPHDPQSHTPQHDEDMIQCYQNGRFQYEMARQRLVKELESDNIDGNNAVRMVNFVFSQIERDLGQLNNHAVGTGSTSTPSSGQQPSQGGYIGGY